MKKYIFVLIFPLLGFLIINSGTSAFADDCPYGYYQCKNGYVWREAYSNDRVCVTPQIREKTQFDNSQAEARKDPKCTSGDCTYGEDQCKLGFVWREASPEDRVCVIPKTRERTKIENSLADSRRDPKCTFYPRR